MALDYDALMSLEIPPREVTYTQKDTMLYALGLGLGTNPAEPAELQFVYEKNLKALPTMSVVLGIPVLGPNIPGTGLDGDQILHGEQGVVIHRPLPVEGTLISTLRISGVIDKGPEKGALVYTEGEARDKLTQQVLFTTTGTAFCRGDGGFGGPSGPAPEPHPLPQRAPEAEFTIETHTNQALLYRLSGDYNLVHADPDVAQNAGFEQPILQGLCTFGIAGYGVLKAACGSQPERLRSLQARFSAPVYPGDTLRTSMWKDGPVVSFSTWAMEREVLVIDNGRAEIIT